MYGSLVTIIKLEAKHRFCVAVLLFYLLLKT